MWLAFKIHGNLLLLMGCRVQSSMPHFLGAMCALHANASFLDAELKLAASSCSTHPQTLARQHHANSLRRCRKGQQGWQTPLL